MKLLLIAQIIVSIALIILILLQQRGTALGSAFGQEGFYIKKRGPEKIVFYSSIVLAVLFILLSILNLII